MLAIWDRWKIADSDTLPSNSLNIRNVSSGRAVYGPGDNYIISALSEGDLFPLNI